MELFYLQLTIWAFLRFLLTALAFHLQLEHFCLQWEVRPIRALRDCKPRSLTISKKTPTVSKKLKLFFLGPFWPETQENKQKTSGEGPFFLCKSARGGLPETLDHSLVIVPSDIRILCIFWKRPFVHKMFTTFVPLTPPLPISKLMDFLLNFYWKDLKQNCEHSAKIANKPSKNCEQTELWTNGRFWIFRVFAIPIFRIVRVFRVFVWQTSSDPHFHVKGETICISAFSPREPWTAKYGNPTDRPYLDRH